MALDGMTLATGRDFTETGELRAESEVRQLDEGAAQDLAARLTGRPFTVKSVNERPFRRSPAAPFITSTLQQEAGRKLRFGAQRTMQVAQRLYEQGWITYMRTDSTTLSDEALGAARDQAARLYGAEYVPDRPRRYEKKVKNAQEAHEAIRPAGDTFRTPEQAVRQSVRRRAAPLRPDLEAHRRLADGRRQRDHRAGADRGNRVTERLRAGRGRRVRGFRDGRHVPRIPAGLRGRIRRSRRRARRARHAAAGARSRVTPSRAPPWSRVATPPNPLPASPRLRS